jgi:hypothetical protein
MEGAGRMTPFKKFTSKMAERFYTLMKVRPQDNFSVKLVFDEPLIPCTWTPCRENAFYIIDDHTVQIPLLNEVVNKIQQVFLKQLAEGGWKFTLQDFDRHLPDANDGEYTLPSGRGYIVTMNWGVIPSREGNSFLFLKDDQFAWYKKE